MESLPYFIYPPCIKFMNFQSEIITASGEHCQNARGISWSDVVHLFSKVTEYSTKSTAMKRRDIFVFNISFAFDWKLFHSNFAFLSWLSHKFVRFMQWSCKYIIVKAICSAIIVCWTGNKIIDTCRVVRCSRHDVKEDWIYELEFINFAQLLYWTIFI